MLDNLKKLLKEYNNLKEEKKDIQNSLSRIQKQLERLEEKGYKVKDSVKGGEGGIQIFKVEGYPYPEYIRVKTKSLLQQQKLNIKMDKMDVSITKISLDTSISRTSISGRMSY